MLPIACLASLALAALPSQWSDAAAVELEGDGLWVEELAITEPLGTLSLGGGLLFAVTLPDGVDAGFVYFGPGRWEVAPPTPGARKRLAARRGADDGAGTWPVALDAALLLTTDPDFSARIGAAGAPLDTLEGTSTVEATARRPPDLLVGPDQISVHATRLKAALMLSAEVTRSRERGLPFATVLALGALDGSHAAIAHVRTDARPSALLGADSEDPWLTWVRDPSGRALSGDVERVVALEASRAVDLAATVARRPHARVDGLAQPARRLAFAGASVAIHLHTDRTAVEVGAASNARLALQPVGGPASVLVLGLEPPVPTYAAMPEPPPSMVLRSVKTADGAELPILELDWGNRWVVDLSGLADRTAPITLDVSTTTARRYASFANLGPAEPEGGAPTLQASKRLNDFGMVAYVPVLPELHPAPAGSALVHVQVGLARNSSHTLLLPGAPKLRGHEGKTRYVETTVPLAGAAVGMGRWREADAEVPGLSWRSLARTSGSGARDASHELAALRAALSERGLGADEPLFTVVEGQGSLLPWVDCGVSNGVAHVRPSVGAPEAAASEEAWGAHFRDAELVCAAAALVAQPLVRQPSAEADAWIAPTVGQYLGERVVDGMRGGGVVEAWRAGHEAVLATLPKGDSAALSRHGSDGIARHAGPLFLAAIEAEHGAEAVHSGLVAVLSAATPATTGSVRAALERAAGAELGDLFDAWVEVGTR